MSKYGDQILDFETKNKNTPLIYFRVWYGGGAKSRSINGQIIQVQIFSPIHTFSFICPSQFEPSISDWA